MTEKEMIEFWKTNEKPYSMATEEQRNWFVDFRGAREVWYGKWLAITSVGGTWGKDAAVRIPPDYQSEKRGRWVECAVEWAGPQPHFIFRHPAGALHMVHEAPGMVGFGGVFYPEKGWIDGLFYWSRCKSEDSKPLTPTKVRFWVEE